MNPAPEDRVLLTIGHERGVSCYLPQWRVGRPGRSHVASCVGDGYSKFLAFWGLVGQTLRDWDRAGRPGPVFSHLSPSEQAFINEGSVR